jgi:hypothetical protein
MSLDRQLDSISESTKSYRSKYGEYFEFFESESVAARSRGVKDEDLYALGKQLESFERWKSFTEANGSAGDLGVLPNIALDVITASQAQSPVPLMAGVQPIN